MSDRCAAGPMVGCCRYPVLTAIRVTANEGWTASALSSEARTASDTLPVAEAFAVGVQAFQRKFRDKPRRFRAEGKTIVFVSHAPAAVTDVCSPSVLSNEGPTVTMGGSAEVMDDYPAMLEREQR